MELSVKKIASEFVNARLASRSLPSYPGPIPDQMSTSYLCQSQAIGQWPDSVAGWKVGSIRADLAEELGQNRLIGPIFRKGVRHVSGGVQEFRTFDGGFAAAEPEFVLELATAPDEGKLDWSIEEARALVGTVYHGVEIAGSPLATINDLGPKVVVSDFGNNDGLLLGQRVADWSSRPFEEWRAELYIDERLTGQGSVADLVGGPFESLRFALEQTARMGHRMKKGSLISTGAITGVHQVVAGQKIRAVFGSEETIELMGV